jgi:hypothetical protein
MTHEPHSLTIVSLHDAQAHCLCGRWSYVRTGAASREDIRAQYFLHAKPTTGRKP